MKLLNVKNKPVSKNVSKYIIDWKAQSKSKPQWMMKQFLKPYWSHYVVYEEFPVYGSLLKVDFLNASLKIAIEVHGPQHAKFHFFHNGKPLNYLNGIKNDYIKREWLEKNNFKVVEITSDEVATLSKEFFLEKFNIRL